MATPTKSAPPTLAEIRETLTGEIQTLDAKIAQAEKELKTLNANLTLDKLLRDGKTSSVTQVTTLEGNVAVNQDAIKTKLALGNTVSAQADAAEAALRTQLGEKLKDDEVKKREDEFDKIDREIETLRSEKDSTEALLKTATENLARAKTTETETKQKYDTKKLELDEMAGKIAQEIEQVTKLQKAADEALKKNQPTEALLLIRELNKANKVLKARIAADTPDKSLIPELTAAQKNWQKAQETSKTESSRCDLAKTAFEEAKSALTKKEKARESELNEALAFAPKSNAASK